MSNLPQGQDYYDLFSFLEAWKERYGFLTNDEESRFLSDQRLLQILTHHKYAVEASLDKFKLFDAILDDLSFKMDESSDFVEITPEDLGMENEQPYWYKSGE